MRKLAAFLGALTLSLGLLVGISPSAQALVAQQCQSVPVNNQPDPHVCIEVTYSPDGTGGVGYYVTKIDITAYDTSPAAEYESDPALDGYAVRLFNSNGNIVWQVGGDSNLTGDCPCRRTWNVNLHPGNASYLTILYDFKARIQFGGDVDNQTIGKTWS